MTLYIKIEYKRKRECGEEKERSVAGRWMDGRKEGRRASSAQSRQSVGVIKDMRGDGDGLARTPVKVLMVAGHAAFLFKVCVCVCVMEEIEERQAGSEGGR